MSVDVQVEVEIRRPRAEVAAFMFDPSKDAIWTQGVVECHPRQPGLLAPGHQVERISKFLGRRLSYLIEVTAMEPERFVEMHADKPFEMHVRYELADLDGADGGRTLARITTRGGGTGFFRVAAPLLSKMVERAIRGDLETLRDYLEQELDRRADG